MDTREIVDLCRKHTFYTWSAQGGLDPLPVERAEGVYFWTTDGQQVLDFNSQLMSVNIGHSHPKVVAAMREAAGELIYAWPGSATAVRARLGKKLADLCPGDLNTFFFTLGGAEANENALKLVKQATGRQKILARYRSYHGGTNACMGLTGDPRRWANEPGMPGIVHVMDPWPYKYSFGETESEITESNLRYLEEVIDYEGGQTIAAMFIEATTGTNGVLPPPAGYLKGLKALLDRHGILLVCDEVMAGFGRTGKLFSFEHDDILPDVVTMAKGLTSSYVPLGAVAMRDHVAERFADNVFWGGLTYNSHAFCLAVAEANIDVLLGEGLIERAAAMEPVMRRHMDEMVAKHPSAKCGRVRGLFGIMEVQKNAAGEPAAPYNGSSEAMRELAGHFRREGLFTFVRWHNFMCNPPLIITEEQIAEGFEIIDRGLDITDRFFEE